MADKRLILDYLQDILDAMAKAQAFLGDMGRRTFEADERTSYAVIRALELAGEAARHIPEEVTLRYPKIPWSDMIGMRNVLIHDYLEVDLGGMVDRQRRSPGGRTGDQADHRGVERWLTWSDS